MSVTRLKTAGRGSEEQGRCEAEKAWERHRRRRSGIRCHNPERKSPGHSTGFGRRDVDSLSWMR